MKYLVDTNVLSEPTKPRPFGQVVKWLTTNELHLAVNPIILGELELGIRLLSAGRPRTQLLKWFAHGIQRLRVLDIDAQTASIWSHIVADLRRKGKTMPIKDSLIAASARQHRLTVATRNIADYQNAGVAVVNPFDSKRRNSR